MNHFHHVGHLGHFGGGFWLGLIAIAVVVALVADRRAPKL